MPLGLRVTGAVVTPASGGTVTAQLHQAVAPWRCETYLRVSRGEDGAHLDGRLPQVQQAAVIIGGLLAVTERALAARPVGEPR